MTNEEYKRFRELSENKAFKSVFKEFKSISNDIDLEGINEDNVEERVNKSLKNNDIEKVLFALWLLIGVSYVRSTFKQFSTWEKQEGLPIPKNRASDFKIGFGVWLNSYRKKKKVEGILNTYKETVKSAVEKATVTATKIVADKAIESITEAELRVIIQQEISNEAKKIIKARDFYAGESQRIAITEATFATNNANGLAGDFTDIKVIKQWITFVDGRERPWHREVNLVTVPKDSFFIVYGQRLLWPGDDKNGATGQNLISCRCRFGYRRDRNNN